MASLVAAAVLLRHIAGTKADADLLQEVIGRRSAGKNPYIVVRELARLPLNVDNDGLLFEFDRIRVEQNFNLAGLHALGDPLRVAFLDAAELRAAIDQRDLVADLVSQPHGCFDRAIATAHDQNLLVDVMVRLNQPVHHLG